MKQEKLRESLHKFIDQLDEDSLMYYYSFLTCFAETNPQVTQSAFVRQD